MKIFDSSNKSSQNSVSDLKCAPSTAYKPSTKQISLKLIHFIQPRNLQRLFSTQTLQRATKWSKHAFVLQKSH